MQTQRSPQLLESLYSIKNIHNICHGDFYVQRSGLKLTVVPKNSRNRLPYVKLDHVQ